MTKEQRGLIEEFGLLHEQMRATPMTGRVTAWLLFCEPPEQSLTEIAQGLGVSKAAVSVAARMLLQAKLAERVATPGRRGDYYRAAPADLLSILPLDQVRSLHDLLARGLAAVADRDQSQSNFAIMHERLDFMAFIEEQLSRLPERWRERRSSTVKHPTPPAGGTT